MDTPSLRFLAIDRSRLSRLIGGSLEELKPLTLLHAPAGFSKTTSVLHWSQAFAARGEADVTWVRTPDSRSAASAAETMWGLISLALRRLEGVERAEAETAERAEAPHRDDREALERRLSALPRPTVVVIEDYQHLSSGETDLALARLLERTRLLHLVVLSRRFTSLDGPLVSSRVVSQVIGFEELAFTEEESLELARDYGLPDTSSVRRLCRLANGWPLMVHSVLQEISKTSEGREIMRTITRFGRQHLDEIALPGGRRALLAVVLCEGVSLEMLSQLVSASLGETEVLARRLTELGLLASTLCPDTTRYFCHPGLRETLLAPALQEFGDEAPTIRQRHAADLSRDEPVAAVKLLLDHAFYDDAARLLTRYFLEIMDSGRGILVRLRQVPDEIVQQHPSLIAASLLLETPEVDTPDRRLEQLYQWLREAVRSQLLEGDFDQNTAVIASLLVAERMRGNTAEMMRLAADVETRTERLPESRLSHYRYTLPLVFSALGLTGLLSGDSGMAERGYRRATETAARFGILSEEMRGLNGLAAAAAMLGNMPEAELRVRTAQSQHALSRIEDPGLSWANLTIAKAVLACERYDAGAAEAALVPVLGLLQRLEQWPYLLQLEARQHWISHGPGPAMEELHRLQAEAQGGFPSTAHLRIGLTAFSARLLIALGNYAEAEQRLESLPQQHPEVMIVRALLAVYSNDFETVPQLVPGLDAIGLTHSQRAEALLISATGHWRLDQEAEAFEALAASLEPIRRYRLRLPLSSPPYETLLELATAAHSAGIPDVLALVGEVPETLRSESRETLSPAELRVLASLAEGLTQAATAQKHFISVNTVKFHLRSVYRKLEVSNRGEAIERARQMRLLEEE